MNARGTGRFGRWRSRWLRNPRTEGPWLAIIALFVLTLALGYWGYHRAFGGGRSWGDKLYASLQLFGLEFVAGPQGIPTQLQIARWMAPVVAAAATLVAIYFVFRRQFTEILARRHQGQVVVCGLGPCGLKLAKDFRARGEKVVVIEKTESSAAEECRHAGITVIIGDARDERVLIAAGIRRAGLVVAACGDDGTNAETATRVAALVKDEDRDVALDCFVHIDDSELYTRLLEAAPAVAGDGQRGEGVRFHLFNPSAFVAPLILLEDPAFDPDPGLRPTEPHILIVGMGQMGRRLTLLAARRWRLLRAGPSDHLTITALGSNGESRTDLLRLRNDWLGDACTLYGKDIDVTKPEFELGAFLTSPKGHRVTSVYICLHADDVGLSAAFALRRGLDRLHADRVPIVVRTTTEAGLATLARRTRSRGGLHPRAFGLLPRGCTPETLLSPRNELLAQVLHHDELRRRLRHGETYGSLPDLREWSAVDERHRGDDRDKAERVGRELVDRGCFIVPLQDYHEDVVSLPDDVASIPRLLVQAELFAMTGDHWEHVAHAIHDDYLRARQEDGEKLGSRDALRHWGQLGEDYRESNRGQARHIETKLAAIGCHLDSLTARLPTLVTFRHAEIERMAEMEHERWCEEKAAAGFTFGPGGDDAPGTHADLVPWRDLDEERREIDRQAVRGIPEFLGRVGFAVVRGAPP